MTCWPTGVMEIWRLYEHQYGIPVSVILGLIVGMIILAIYVHTRSLAHLAVMGIYAISIFSAMWASNEFFEEQINVAIYVIAIAIASVTVMFVLRLVKE
jgi:hypothetical protein